MTFTTYKITRGDEVLWIGATTTALNMRWPLSRLRKKFGAEPVVMVAVAKHENALAMYMHEAMLIASLEPTHNKSCGGAAPSLGIKHTYEARSKIRKASYGKKHTAEVRNKIGAANIGKKKSAETRAKISAAQKGRNPSPETRAKMSASQRARFDAARKQA